MKLISENFKHLDEIPTEFTSRDISGGILPSFSWYNYPNNCGGFLILMLNSKTGNLHWGAKLPPDITNVKTGETTGYEVTNSWGKNSYHSPDDEEDVVTYIIQLWALKDITLNYPEIIEKNNILDVAFIKFLYNGY